LADFPYHKYKQFNTETPVYREDNTTIMKKWSQQPDWNDFSGNAGEPVD
jgi:hypothetical protein